MLKKLLEGFVFGAGFAVALVLVWAITVAVVMPHLVTSLTMETTPPRVESPKEAQVVERSAETREFSFFRSAGERMKIPPGGGILSMSSIATASDAMRPDTYQLWMTESQLWQIRTIGEKAEIEELPYPQNASVDNLDSLMREKLGIASLQSTMTVSAEEIARLRSTGSSWRDEALNGTLRVSVEGVVFVIPNRYEP
ncbi:hypothetical protein [Pseudothauera rhizosphaerae]|uniref:Uncharacterized protein n=1 Tax=Pseudothauera rhizosphaerae TaxID=2565932 RepID=A0A4V3WB84_9RHOO|nr:hypothetical protein [Pseudothauera rhizosphaerae]THF62226.1 hypothetical protein E6O51_08735 [Pseudothauera rhizosphaerae]